MNLNRIPPNLLYLAIYNPSLHPTGPVDDDNEDAEEQAHILFYTSKERAVSRDRMLRQIGLAKALVNFAEMFNPDDPCNNVHSQSKRMIMVSPEPDFWIHAGIEVAKVVRPAVAKAKGKGKEKPKAPEKGKESNDIGPIYDYDDGSVHDIALRGDLLRAYEKFKLTHGSFTSILSSLGQEALELQLERFFTVWAWSWNLECGHDFEKHLGVPVHPFFSSVLPTIDHFACHLPEEIHPVVLCSTTAIPSTTYLNARYPSSLIRHLLSMIPPAPESFSTNDPLASSVDTIKGKQPQDLSRQNTMKAATSNDTSQNHFMGIPNMNVNMDMRKWNWPGYLTFGRASGKNPPNLLAPESEKKASPTEEATPQQSAIEVQVDRSALEEAMSSDSISVTSSKALTEAEDQSEDVAKADSPSMNSITNSPTTDRHPSVEEYEQSPSEPSETPSPPEDVGLIDAPPLPSFLSMNVHLSRDDPLVTRRTKIYFLIRDQWLLALPGAEAGDSEDDDNLHLNTAAGKAYQLFDDLESKINERKLASLTESLPTANRILQHVDSHIISAGEFTESSPGFISKSSHLYNAKALQEMDPDISEVYSRGQNPQHWHIAKRGLAPKEGLDGEGEVYLEVFRKETSLTDVDNVLAGVVINSSLVDGKL
ncbi:hypothetical protein BDQ12DRAFT_681350 [Crucibulum laeve]|uniref:CCZ1/INTU/HSP4 first Longin domain-containing protein n=1 Tax=Crucibulum laeve TaxID=68775 RepID=A0A5C3M5D7_9AGAR|nr:hypothetical protein BDQ12DRAFT_681350 [Crucibulum laeve]